MADQEQLEIVLKLKDEFSSGVGNAKKGLDLLGNAGSVLGNSLKTTGMVVSGALAGAGYAVKGFVEKAGQFESVKDAFEGMGKSLNVTSDGVIESVKNATRGTISEYSILSSAVRAGSLIGKEAMGDFGVNFERMAVVAKKASRATGQDVDFMFDSIVTGVGRNSPMILDNLGITMKVSEAYEKWGEEIGKNANDLTVTEQKTAVLNYALSQAEEKYKDVAVSAGGYSGALQKWNATMEDVKIKVGTVFLPIFNEIMRAMQPAIDFLVNYFITNKDQIVNTINNIAENIKSFSKTVWENIKPAVDAVVDFFSQVENKKPIMIATLTVLGAAIVAFITSIVVSMAPITLAILALGASVFVLSKAWNENWGGIQDKTKAVMEAIIGFYNSYLVPFFNQIKIIVNSLVDWWKKNWDSISSIFEGVWKIMKGMFQIGWAVLSGTIKVAIDIFTGNWKKAWEDIKTAFGGIWEGIKNIFSGVWDGIKGIFITSINFLIDKLNKFISHVNEIDIPDFVPGVGGKGINIKSIPRLETGTNYVPRDTLAYIHEGEAVVPKQFNPSAGGVAGGGGISINFYGDNTFKNEDDMEKLIEKIRFELSRDQEKANWGIA